MAALRPAVLVVAAGDRPEADWVCQQLAAEGAEVARVPEGTVWAAAGAAGRLDAVIYFASPGNSGLADLERAAQGFADLLAREPGGRSLLLLVGDGDQSSLAEAARGVRRAPLRVALSAVSTQVGTEALAYLARNEILDKVRRPPA